MHYIVFDLEATCWPKETPGVRQEIIEIGAIRLDQTGQVRGEFHRMVRPVIHPMLSPYCRNLTGIRQEEVSSAKTFAQVLPQFLDWLYFSEEYLLLSWGGRDKFFLEQDCRLHRLESDWLQDSHHDLKTMYKEMFRLPGKLSLQSALRRENLVFEGEAHRALEDARNTVHLFLRHIDEWPLLY